MFDIKYIIITGATDHSCLGDQSEWKYKIFTTYCCNFLIFNINIPLTLLSTASSGSHPNYSYGIVFCSSSTLWVKFHHCHFNLCHVFLLSIWFKLPTWFQSCTPLEFPKILIFSFVMGPPLYFFLYWWLIECITGHVIVTFKYLELFWSPC